MSLTNLSQIKGLKSLRGEVNLLLKSYDAAKVVTQIAEAEGEGNYNVEELLEVLKSKLDAITGESGEGQSLDALKKAIDELKNKELAGIIYNKAYDDDPAHTPEEYIQGTVRLGDEDDEDGNFNNILVRTADELVDAKAYQNALDALVAKLAANKELIEAVKALVGDKSAQAQIDEAIANVNAALALKADQGYRFQGND